jgi:hypothetical protein
VVSTKVLTEAFLKENFENGVRGFHGGVDLHFGVTKKIDVAYYETLVTARRTCDIKIQ